jgi:hypothetical protein
MEPSHRTVLLVAGGVFLLYVLLKSRVSFVPRTAEARAARQRIGQAKKRARLASAPIAERAAAWREAADTALSELDRPDLAASYALRAERLDPEDRAAVGLLSLAMRKSTRLRALEKLLWRRLDSHVVASPAYEEAFTQLNDLYTGPLRAPERARALQKLRKPS